MMTQPTKYRFFPAYNDAARRYQRFVVNVEWWGNDDWQPSYDYLSDHCRPSPEMRAYYPVHCAIIDSLTCGEWPGLSKDMWDYPQFALDEMRAATRLIQKWERAEFLLALQGLSHYRGEQWEQHKIHSLTKGCVHAKLERCRHVLYNPPPQPRVSPPSPVRPSRAVVYLIHAQPFDADTLVGYVGQTINPDSRERKHLSGKDRSTSLLVASIKSSGKKPAFTILQTCSPKQLSHYEKKWYGTLTAAGWKLFNEVELVSR